MFVDHLVRLFQASYFLIYCYFSTGGQLNLFIKEDRNYRALNRLRGIFFAPVGCSLFGWWNRMCAKTCVLEYLWFVKKTIQDVCCIKSKGTYPFVTNELRLEPKFCEVGRARFHFWVNDNLVIENYKFMLNTMKNTATAISAYNCIFFIGEAEPSTPIRFSWVYWIFKKIDPTARTRVTDAAKFGHFFIMEPTV
jgi:hypothetical protein